jgi:hypothetical protein
LTITFKKFHLYVVEPRAIQIPQLN